MVIFSMLQNSLVNKYLVKKNIVFIFLFFLLQKFDLSNVMATGLNEEIGRISNPHLNYHYDEVEVIWSAIDEARDELKKLKQKQLQTIMPFKNANELKEEFDSLTADCSVLLNLKRSCNFKKQAIIDEISSSEETQQNFFVEFENNDSLLPNEEQYIYDPALNSLLVKPTNTTELEYDLNSPSNFDAEEQEQAIAKQVSFSITPSPSARLERVNKELANLIESISMIENHELLLKEKEDEYYQQLSAIQQKETDIHELEKKRKALIESESKLANMPLTHPITQSSSVLVPRTEIDTCVDLEQIFGNNFGLKKLFEGNAPIVAKPQHMMAEQRQQLQDEGYYSSENLIIGATQPSTITESNPIQQNSRGRKWVDSVTRNWLSLREELKVSDQYEIFGDSFGLETLFEENVPIVAKPQHMVAEQTVPIQTMEAAEPIVPIRTMIATEKIVQVPTMAVAKLIAPIQTMVVEQTLPIQPMEVVEQIAPIQTMVAEHTVQVPTMAVAKLIAPIQTMVVEQTLPIQPMEVVEQIAPIQTMVAEHTVQVPTMAVAKLIAPIQTMVVEQTLPIQPMEVVEQIAPIQTMVAEHTVQVPTMAVAKLIAPIQTMVVEQTLPIQPMEVVEQIAPIQPMEVVEQTLPIQPMEVVEQIAPIQTMEDEVKGYDPNHRKKRSIAVPDKADVVPYEDEESFGLETLFKEEEPIAAEPNDPVDDPPSPVATQTDSETEQTNSETKQSSPEDKQPDSETTQSTPIVEQPDLKTTQSNSEDKQPDSKTTQSTPIVEQPDSETTQSSSEDKQPDSVVIPSAQTLTEENSYIPSINFDIEKDIAKYTTYIEFDYLDMISNALTIRNHILTDNSTANVVAAGDNDYIIKKGGWIQFIRSITKQQQQGNILAFKNNQQGVILGFDAQPLDKLIIGIAYALASSHTKLQTIFNDKQNTILHVAAIYTQYTLSPNIYLNSYLKYGKAFIKNKGERNNIAIDSKTEGYITRAKLETYYKMDLDKFLFKPIVGIIFDRFLINNFTEYRKEFNINVPTKKGERILLETGISLSRNILVKDISIIPEVHIKLDNTVLLNNSTGTITFTNTLHQTPIVVPTIKPVGSSAKNVKYTLGGYVNVQSVLPFKLGAGYDYSFKRNFNTHSFYLNGLIKF
ncbi:autotransporter domain-containing protein [Candidatus Tisiphia endosymbiont of Hybos culiciformis]|uniref:autotransporter domain-containing protein n=1 Tax=Candidatus Tisiphia endosymbiont of Hybos culiciformis TaxID=3139331 RepID=UPI003CCAFD09